MPKCDDHAGFWARNFRLQSWFWFYLGPRGADGWRVHCKRWAMQQVEMFE